MKLTSHTVSWPKVQLCLGLLFVALTGLNTLTLAQTAQGTPTDLNFEVINATTGQPTAVERMTIEYVRERRNGIIDFEPSGSSFIAPRVPIIDGGEYIVAVWYEGIPYWWSRRGHQLIGQTTLLHVFDTSRDLEGVVIEGMDIVLRQDASLLKIEMMLKIRNETSPQVTVFNSGGTVELKIPSATDQIKGTYRRGPEPVEFPIHQGNARLELMAPLTPGLNSIRLVASVPWQDGMTYPVASNLEITSWSMLTAPAWLVVLSNELRQESSSSLPGYTRWNGSQLDAGRQLDLRLTTGPDAPGEATDLFTQEANKALAKENDRADVVAEKKGGLSLPLVISGVMIIILGVAAFRRKMM